MGVDHKSNLKDIQVLSSPVSAQVVKVTWPPESWPQAIQVTPLGGGPYPSVEVQLAYSTAQANSNQKCTNPQFLICLSLSYMQK